MTPIEVASAVERIFRGAWISSLLAKKPARLVSVALANKTARIAWALLARGEVYRLPRAARHALTAVA